MIIQTADQLELYKAMNVTFSHQPDAPLLGLPNHILSTIFSMLPIKDTVAFMTTCRFTVEQYGNNDDLWKPLLIFKISAWGIPEFSERIQQLPVTGLAKIYPVVHEWDHNLIKAKIDRDKAKETWIEMRATLTNPPDFFKVKDAMAVYKIKREGCEKAIQDAKTSVLLQCATNLIRRDVPKARKALTAVENKMNYKEDEFNEALEIARSSPNEDNIARADLALAEYNQAINDHTAADARFVFLSQETTKLHDELVKK